MPATLLVTTNLYDSRLMEDRLVLVFAYFLWLPRSNDGYVRQSEHVMFFIQAKYSVQKPVTIVGPIYIVRI